jgi:hypothetical protein
MNEDLKDKVTLEHMAPIYLENELCGITHYEVDLTGFLTRVQALELGHRIKTAQARAVSKAVVEAAEILRSMDKPKETS